MGIKPNLGPIFTYDVTDHPDERFVSRDPELMMALATLSKGNVQLGDNPENTDIDLVSTCCNINGEIIGPEKSIGPLSSFYHTEQDAGSDQMVWRTFSLFENLQSDIILTYATESESIISIDDLVAGNNIYYSPKLRQCFSYDANLTIPSTNSIGEKLQLWYTSLSEDGVAVLGDISKIVPLSSNRFESISYNKDSLRIVFSYGFCVGS